MTEARDGAQLAVAPESPTDQLALLIRDALNTVREAGYQRARSVFASSESESGLAAAAQSAQTNADVATVRMWSALYRTAAAATKGAEL